MATLHWLKQLWIGKYEIALVGLALLLFFYLSPPHHLIVPGIALFKVLGLQVKFEKVVPSIWFDFVLGLYLLLLGHWFLAITIFALGRLRDFSFGITPGEEQNNEYWKGDRFRPK